MTARADVRFARTSPVCTYWLSRCAGFRVESPAGRCVGTVEEVALGASSAAAAALLVRRGRWLRARRVVVDPAAVAAVSPWSRAIVLEPPRQRARSLQAVAGGRDRAGRRAVALGRQVRRARARFGPPASRLAALVLAVATGAVRLLAAALVGLWLVTVRTSRVAFPFVLSALAGGAALVRRTAPIAARRGRNAVVALLLVLGAGGTLVRRYSPGAAACARNATRAAIVVLTATSRRLRGELRRIVEGPAVPRRRAEAQLPVERRPG